jgi:polysaccharide export outer membrane protein
MGEFFFARRHSPGAASAVTRRASALFMLLVLACAGGLAGCSGSSNGEFELMPGTQKTGSGLTLASATSAEGKAVRLPRAADALTAGGTPGNTGYKIGPADVLDISVFKVPELARTVVVDDRGMINVPLLGDVRAAGRTARELERELAKKLGAKFLQSPQVTVSIKEYNSQRVTVEGAIKTPGVHSLKGQTTLMQLVAMSGGLDQATSDATIVVFRNTDGKRYAARFDFNAIKTGQAEDPQIMPGDVVVANSSTFKAAWADFLKALPVASFALLLL